MTRSAPTAHARRGFTLAELIAATVILAFITSATVTATMQVVRARDGAAARLEAWSRASAAADRIARDAAMTVRDADLYAARLIVRSGDRATGRWSGARDELLVVSRATRAVREAVSTLSGAEGAEAEVQYRVVDDAGLDDAPPSLWRRADSLPDSYQDAGGIAEVLVDGVLSLSIEAYDGQSWYETWDSDFDGYPHALRIQVRAADDSGRSRATVRRVVAIDRPPLPVTPTGAETEADAAGGSGGQTGTGGGR